MPIATIPKTDPVVVPATTERTYSALDLRKLLIKEQDGVYSIQGIFLPHDTVSGDTMEEGEAGAMSFAIHNFADYLDLHPDLKTKTKDFVKALAAALQE
ncbi:MAG: hypothetical protein ACYS7Y_29260 [Planctomycetota bacterium]|jgi:hypothetical protein